MTPSMRRVYRFMCSGRSTKELSQIQEAQKAKVISIVPMSRRLSAWCLSCLTVRYGFLYTKEYTTRRGTSLMARECSSAQTSRTYVYTETEPLVSMIRKMSPLQISTYIGCAISMITLTSLLSIYIVKLGQNEIFFLQ